MRGIKIAKSQHILSAIEIDETIKKLKKDLKDANFEPDIVIGITRGGSVLGRIFSHELGCDFDRFESAYGHLPKNFEFEKLDRNNHKKILVVDDSTNRGYTIESCILEIINKTKPKIDKQFIIEKVLESISGYMEDVLDFEDGKKLTYKRQWLYQKKLLQQINPKIDSNDIIGSLREQIQIGVQEYNEMFNINGCDTKITFKEELLGYKKEKNLVSYVNLLINGADITIELLGELIENAGIAHHDLRKIIQGEDIDIRFYILKSPDGSDALNPDFEGSIETNFVLPWSIRENEWQEAIENLKKGKFHWKDAAIDEIEKQYKEKSKHAIFEFYEKSFIDLSENIEKGSDISSEYSFKFDIRNLEVNDFFKFLEEKGIKFERESDFEGIILGDMKLIGLDFDYIVRSNGERIKFKFKLNPHEVRSYDGCIKNCKKEELEDDSVECQICSNYKRSLVFLVKSSGIYGWLNRHKIQEIVYTPYIDGKRLGGLSTDDILKDIQIIKNAYQRE